MDFLKTKYERKSFIISTVLFIVMFILFLFVGLKYLDPPLENGIAVNFGTMDTGYGDVQPTEPIASEPEITEEMQEEIMDEVAEEEIVTQEVEEAPVVRSKPIKEEKPKENKPKPEEVKPKPKVEQVPEPTPSKKTTDALSSLINGPKADGKKAEGEGNDQSGGDKGSIDGSLYSSVYHGSGQGTGLGNGNSWGLNGRKLSSQSVVKPNCDEQGKVVVQIWVNQSGEVIKARQSKGTDNSAPCLIEAAIKTAKTFNWHPDTNAPKIQVGFIVVNFKLG